MFDLKQVEPGLLGQHFGQLGFTRTGGAVQQDIDPWFIARHRVGQHIAQHRGLLAHKSEVHQGQVCFAREPGKHGHQLRLVPVLAHQHGRQLLAHLHQVCEVGDVVLGDQVFHQADAFQARAGAQGLAQLLGIHMGHFGNGGVGLGRVVHLELHQNAAHIPLVAGQRTVQQQGALRLVELKQARQRIDVFLHQRGLLFQGLLQPLSGDCQHRNQVLGLVFGVFIQKEKQRGLVVRAAPGAKAAQKLRGAQRLVPTPQLIAHTAAGQEFAQPGQHRHRPDQVPPGQADHPIEIAPHIETGALAGSQGQHKMRAHQIQHRRALQPGRR